MREREIGCVCVGFCRVRWWAWERVLTLDLRVDWSTSCVMVKVESLEEFDRGIKGMRNM